MDCLQPCANYAAPEDFAETEIVDADARIEERDHLLWCDSDLLSVPHKFLDRLLQQVRVYFIKILGLAAVYGLWGVLSAM